MVHSITSKKGFTIIELLVVIAIIGILASVVLVAVNNARDKGTNAGIKSNLSSMKSQASLFYENFQMSYDDGFSSVCTSNESATPPGIAHMVLAADTLDATAVVECNDDAASWAAAAGLVGEDSGSYFCVDSTGFSGELVGTVGAGGTFDGSLVCN